jgi:hypothetical protein
MADLTVRDLHRAARDRVPDCLRDPSFLMAAQRQHRIYSRSPCGGTVRGDATNHC